MKKKEIIIDGVDVSECNFRLEREKQKCECCHATGFGVICDCEKWHNCYFKQLKRVEQECETLKSENFTFEELVKTQENLIDNYKQALDELEEFCVVYSSDHDAYETVYKHILDIINKANTAPTTIFDRIRSFDSDTFAKFIHSLIKCSENLTCDDCYIATLPFPKRICDTKETLEEIKAWLNEECEDDNNAR